MRDQLIEEAVDFDDPSRDDQGLRRRVRNELAIIKESVRQVVAGQDEVIHLDVVIFNRSRRPNMIIETGLLRVSNEDIEMNLERADSSRLDGYSAQGFSFSRAIDSLDESVRSEARRVFDRQEEVTFGVMDINGKTWEVALTPGD